ncbi:MAG: ATPase [Deltaproteobacteria bacterium]|nr:ATPase [Deltaproteobacteria bacterium]
MSEDTAPPRAPEVPPAGCLYAGIDVGSAATKAVLLSEDGRMVGHHVRRSGADLVAAAETVLDLALAEIGAARSSIVRIVSTGFGRSVVPGAQDTRTEIACHARGAYHHFPMAMTVIDVGGQDNKVIRLAADGRQLGFRMNRKCAAGTGAFLEEIAHRLDVGLGELDVLARQAENRSIRIGSYCTVFAATEVLSRIRAGAGLPELAYAAFESVAQRVLETGHAEGPIVLTGGVAEHSPMLAEILDQKLGTPPLVPPFAQCCGALGAALFARGGGGTP